MIPAVILITSAIGYILLLETVSPAVCFGIALIHLSTLIFAIEGNRGDG